MGVMLLLDNGFLLQKEEKKKKKQNISNEKKKKKKNGGCGIHGRDGFELVELFIVVDQHLSVQKIEAPASIFGQVVHQKTAEFTVSSSNKLMHDRCKHVRGEVSVLEHQPFQHLH
jgi:hypothetical protein